MKMTILSFVVAVTTFASALAHAEQKLTFGRFSSRAIFNPSDDPKCFAPIVILVPGSGSNGPEEMMPPSLTLDGQSDSIFDAYAAGLRRAHVGTLAIGKPGVEFFKSWDLKDKFYNPSLYQNLRWQDLIDNLKDATDFAKTLPCVDPKKITVLGHSEGTVVAVDFATQYPTTLKSLILVGFAGENLATTIDWQFFRRPIDDWLAPDVDTNKDGFISKDEANSWPEFHWIWKPGVDRVSLSEIEQGLRSDPTLQAEAQSASLTKVWAGVYNRAPIYAQAASLSIGLHVFTGELDIQTRPEEALKLKSECEVKKKANCFVSIVPGLGHGMSEPKGPRKQKLLDATLAPVSESFLKRLKDTAASL